MRLRIGWMVFGSQHGCGSQTLPAVDKYFNHDTGHLQFGPVQVSFRVASRYHSLCPSLHFKTLALKISPLTDYLKKTNNKIFNAFQTFAFLLCAVTEMHFGSDNLRAK